MKTLGITGAAGQLGYVCRTRLHHHFNHTVKAIDHAGFENDGKLKEFLEEVDIVIHLAGVNRGSDEEVTQGNLSIAERLVNCLREIDRAVDILYASSIQIDRNNVYGNAKHRAGEILESYCNSAGTKFLNFVLPNLFGEFSRPNYNNVTATFCHQIANGQAPSINNDSRIELMHYVDVADAFHAAINEAEPGVYRPAGSETSVGELAQTLQSMHAAYASQGIFPDMRDPFHLRLFNSYRQILIPDGYPKSLTPHADSRGTFFECIREHNGGQVSFSTTVPGITRGEHFHFFKVERFVVLSGQAKISMRKVFTDQVHDFLVSGDQPCFVDMPTMYTHNLTNVGDSDLTTLFWTHDFFNPDSPDTYLENVEGDRHAD